MKVSLIKPDMKQKEAVPDVPSFTDFTKFLRMQYKEDFFAKSFDGMSVESLESQLAQPSISPKLSVTMSPVTSISTTSQSSSKPLEAKFLYSSKVEVSPKPGPKFLPHNQIIKATFFEDQENSLEEPESKEVLPTRGSILAVQGALDMQRSQGKIKAGLMRVPPKFNFFPSNNKVLPRYVKRPMSRNPKSLTEDSLINETELAQDNFPGIQNANERGVIPAEDQEKFKNGEDKIKNAQDETENAEDKINKNAQDEEKFKLKESGKLKKKTTAQEILQPLHASIERKLLQKFDDMEGEVSITGHILNDSDTDSQLEKPEVAIVKKEEEDKSEVAEQLTALLKRSVLKSDILKGSTQPPSRLSAKSLFWNGKTVGEQVPRPPSSQDQYQKFLARFQRHPEKA
jgi:hypothetical protein